MRNYLQGMDIKLLHMLNDKLRHSLLDRLMPLITYLGNGGFVWILISIFLFYTDTYKIEAYMIVTALIITTIIGEGIIKHTIKRTRPFVHKLESKLLISKPISYSFPSGHTASSFATVGIFLAMNMKFSILIVLLASLIAFSRIYLNVHYPTDVIMGVILGLLCSRLTILLFKSQLMNFLPLAYDSKF